MRFLIAAAISLAVLSEIFSAAAADEPSCPQLRTCSEAIEKSEQFNLDTCLAGKPHEISLSLRASIDVIRKAISGDFKANYDDAVRASSKLNDELQRPENTEIRECLKGIQTIINRCMQSATERCLAQNAYPAGVDLRFRMTFKDDWPDVFDGDRIAISYLEPEHYENPAELNLNKQGWYADHVYMHAPDGRFQGIITRVTKTGFDARQKEHRFETPICLGWAPTPPRSHPASVAFYNCTEAAPAGSCTAHPTDVGWLGLCPPKRASNWLFPSLSGTAHAAPATVSSWVVPSLNTLNHRRDDYLVGFTKFEITATGTSDIEADRVALRTSVNGAELLINGVQGEHQPKPFVPGSTVGFAFGVQSLNLDGRVGGCNHIEAEIIYLKGAERVVSHKVAQNFAAMRQVPIVEKTVGATTYRWTGIYVRPKQQPEHMVFVKSSLASSFEPDQLAMARSEIEVSKSRFDAAGLQIDGKQLVGIVRPPLSNPAYGLGVAIVESTGQLRFVFP